MLSDFFKPSTVLLNDKQGTYGVYGKIPSVGDFFSRGLPRQDILAIDRWLQEGMAALQAVNVEWQTAYLVTPVWRFLLPAGVLGGSAKSGVVMASVDKVGRYFPIIALASHKVVDDLLLLGIAQTLKALSELLPRVIYETLGPDLLFEALASIQLASFDSTDSNEAYRSINATDQRSYWWAVNQQGGKTAMEHTGPLNIALFNKLFGGQCVFL